MFFLCRIILFDSITIIAVAIVVVLHGRGNGGVGFGYVIIISYLKRLLKSLNNCGSESFVANLEESDGQHPQILQEPTFWA